MLPNPVTDFGTRDDTGERDVSARRALRERYHVRNDALGLNAEPLATATESHDDFVRDQQGAGFVTEFTNTLEVARRGRVRAADTDEWFGENRRDGPGLRFGRRIRGDQRPVGIFSGVSQPNSERSSTAGRTSVYGGPASRSMARAPTGVAGRPPRRGSAVIRAPAGQDFVRRCRRGELNGRLVRLAS